MHKMVLLSMGLTVLVFAIDYFSIRQLQRKLADLSLEMES